MFRLLKRGFLVLVGFLLLAIFIWFAGPYFAFASYRPLEPGFNRLVVIGLMVATWVVWGIVRRLRALAASDRLFTAVLRQPHPKEDQPSAEVVRLRERFEEGVATLKQHQRQSGRSLYDLPWYVIIGPPGSGKTTALLNSGLKFPLEQRVGKGAIRGVGGTRNCDWWFTDEAVLLDTAGRYTTQDSDADSDREGWSEFLALLKQHRRRRPLNGVILTVSAADLITLGPAERELQIEAARRRLNELNRELGVDLPVYVMVTKCDLIAGFVEYFDDLPHEGRTQVWGVTFPYEQTTSGEAVRTLSEEFDALMERLNQRLLARIEDDRDVRRRTAIFGFPQQMSALRDLLDQFVSEVFGSTRLESRVLLRGVYFTSGTQEGTPIDRLMGALGRRLGVAADAVVPSTGRGKAYFVERLIRDVMLGESGLAGLNRRFELRKAGWQMGTYAAVALLTIIGVLVLSLSARRNSAYVSEVGAALERLNEVPPVPQTASLATLLPRLDAVRNVVDTAGRYDNGAPWSMRWGLFQGRALGTSARDAYIRELDGALVPRVAARLRERLIEHQADPEALYEYLKAYLMLGEPARLDKPYLIEFARAEWQQVDGAASGGDSLTKHFESLLEYGDDLRPVALDATIIAQARSTIRQASIPRIIYERLKRRYAADDTRAVRLDVAAGISAESVLRRRSGAKLSDPMPAIFTRAVFKEATTTATLDLVKQFAADSWVWGDASMFTSNPLRLASDVTNLYERDYVAAWEDLLNDLDVPPFSTIDQLASALEVLSGAASPLRSVLSTVVQETTLVETAPAPAAAAPPGKIAAAGKAISDLAGKVVKPLSDAAGVPATEPGLFVTAQFQPIRRLMSGAPGAAPIDVILGRVAKVQQQIRSLGPAVGDTSPTAALTNPELKVSLQELQQAAVDVPEMPPVLSGLLAHLRTATTRIVVSGATSEIENRYREEVLRACLEVVPDRYPFSPTSTRDVPMSDFRRLFGFGGVYDRFFRQNLAPLVDTTRRPWTWRPESVLTSSRMLEAFEKAQEVRELFFKPDAGQVSVDFDLILGDTDRGVRRFVLEIDGHYYEYLSGPKRRVKATWPGSATGTNQSMVTFEDGDGPKRGRLFTSQWGWFRLIDHYPGSPDDTRYVLSIDDAGHQGTIEVVAASVRNPIVNREWQRFSCGS